MAISLNGKLSKQDIQAISDMGRQFSDITIQMHEAIARSAGLSGTDHKYLGILIRNGPMSAGELSKLTGLTTGAVTGLIDRLEKRNFAKREFDKHDRRKIIIVSNTQTATKLLGGPFADLQEKMVSLISKLNENELEIIEKYMLSTMEVMKEITDNLNKSKK
jgi:DNA-binding MarR family transcriptional regulator